MSTGTLISAAERIRLQGGSGGPYMGVSGRTACFFHTQQFRTCLWEQDKAELSSPMRLNVSVSLNVNLCFVYDPVGRGALTGSESGRRTLLFRLWCVTVSSRNRVPGCMQEGFRDVWFPDGKSRRRPAKVFLLWRPVLCRNLPAALSPRESCRRTRAELLSA